MKHKKFHPPPEGYYNRELSWVEFNRRVLEEAQDPQTPLLERLKYLAIVSSNLDEFFMVRVASVWDQLQAGFSEPDSSGLAPTELMVALSQRIHELVRDQYHTYRHALRPALKKHRLTIVRPDKLNRKQEEFVRQFYTNTLFPVLTPMVVDQGRPFPLVLNRSLNLALLIENRQDKSSPIFGTIQVPAVLDRLIEIPADPKEKTFILLEDIILMHSKALFKGQRILATGCFRITRNADLGLDEEGAEDLLETIRQSLRQRRWGSVIRLEVGEGMAPSLQERLRQEFEIAENGIYQVNGPLDLSFLMKLGSLPGYESLRFPPLRSRILPGWEKSRLFEEIAAHDILLHHPYDSFDHVVEFVEAAAGDEQVLAIKQTLYRVSGSSPIVAALAQAAESGKQVTVLVELKARFDEEKNIQWAQRLEKAGCHVIYGLVRLKTHCKITLVVRKEPQGIRRYLHLSTGNYNDVTARQYEDLGLFTANASFGADASAVFNMLSGYSQLPSLYKMEVAPHTLRLRLLELIKQEAENARNGGTGRIIAKINSLVDEEIISGLYDASNAGVEIDLIVRGVCCLKPGIPGMSENIRVRSIIGRFLEHSRILHVHAGGENRVYLSSADWMSRNLDRRVELLYPIEDPEVKSHILRILDIYLRDTIKARLLLPDGNYSSVDRRGKEPLSSQDYFLHSQ